MGFHRSVLEDLFAALRRDLGTYDLSSVDGTHRVVLAEGGALVPIDPPYLFLSAPAVASSNEASLGSVTKTCTIEWVACAAAETDDVEARALASLDLAEEVTNAIEDAHHDPTYSTLYGLEVLLVDWDETYGDDPEVPNAIPHVHGTIRYEIDRPRGGS